MNNIPELFLLEYYSKLQLWRLESLRTLILIEKSSHDSGFVCMSSQIIHAALLRKIVPLNHYHPLRNFSLLTLMLQQSVSLPFCHSKIPVTICATQVVKLSDKTMSCCLTNQAKMTILFKQTCHMEKKENPEQYCVTLF